MVVGEEVKGVVQVSRKGGSREEAGTDFSQGNLAALSRLAAVIATHL
jgi:hypothetical protein